MTFYPRPKQRIRVYRGKFKGRVGTVANLPNRGADTTLVMLDGSPNAVRLRNGCLKKEPMFTCDEKVREAVHGATN